MKEGDIQMCVMCDDEEDDKNNIGDNGNWSWQWIKEGVKNIMVEHK